MALSDDVFGKPLGPDEVFSSMQQMPFEGPFSQAVTLTVTAIHTVTQRQLERYISGDLSEVTPWGIQVSLPHKVWAERVLGMYNAIYHKNRQGSSA